MISVKLILGIVLVRVIQRDRINRYRITRIVVRVIQRDSHIYHKELGYTIVLADKSKISSGSQKAGYSGELIM